MRKLFSALLLGGMLTIGLIGIIIAYFAATQLQPEILLAGRVIVYALAAGALTAVVIGCFQLYNWMLIQAIANDQARGDARKTHAEAALIERKVVVWETVAPAGSQVYRHELKPGTYSTALHLSPSPINGERPLVTVSELNRWREYQLLHSTAHRQNNNDAVPLIEAPLEPILPLLIQAQRLILSGGSDAGKTTLVKWIISGRTDHSRIIPIDPHSPSKVLGFDVIGAGRDYEAIGAALESLVLLMTARYEDVKRGLFNYGQHERISVFVDEWTSIAGEVDQAGKLMRTLLTESRKVNIHLVFCVHSTTTEVLGVDAQIRKSATIVNLIGGNGQTRRAFIEPQSKLGPDGKKALPKEYALPGPFAGFVQPAGEVVRALPDARVLRAQMMAENSESLTAIAAAFFDTDKPNGRQIREVKDLLERTTTARQWHDNGTT